MNTLPPLDIDGHIRRLLEWLRPNVPEIENTTLKGFDSHDLVEVGRTWTLPARALRDLEDFKVYLEQILSEGYDWVNLSGYGALPSGEYLVGIEYNPDRKGHPFTSVNLAGPPRTSTGEVIKPTYIVVA